MELDKDGGGLDLPSPIEAFLHRLQMRYTSFKDSTVPYTGARWLCTVLIFALYCIRVYMLEGWYIVSYGLGIYSLNLSIGFLSPVADPAVDGGLPSSESDEFKPFVRKLPEFKFWHSLTRGILIAMGMTFFSLFNVPVFWPILVFYFFALFFMTMRRQIQHMIRHKYLPFSIGKPKFKGKESAEDEPARPTAISAPTASAGAASGESDSRV